MQLRKIRLYPGSDFSLDCVKHWMNVDQNYLGHILFYDQDQNYNELWIDSNLTVDFLNHQPELFDNVDRVCFYDFFHVHYDADQLPFDRIKAVAQRLPTTWYTANAVPVPDIDCVRFDYLWNRTKRVMLEKQPGWKHCSEPNAYSQLPVHFQTRSHKFLSLNRSLGWKSYRQPLIDFLSDKQPGFLSNTSCRQVISNPYVSDVDIIRGITVPPAPYFFNESYVSIQTESQTEGTRGIFFTEKTYDHLLQGRIVLNFGACRFYSTLEKQGWKLFHGIDYSFDNIVNNRHRFQSYLDSLDKLLSLSLLDLHDLFLINKDNIIHNHLMLYNKPYYYIDYPTEKGQNHNNVQSPI